MNHPRKQITEALFNQLQVLNGLSGRNGNYPPQYDFETFSRNTRMWSDDSGAAFPAFYLCYLGESVSQPQAWGAIEYRLRYLALMYFKTSPNGAQEAEDISFTILDALDGFLSQPGNPQTLGNLVAQAYIDGEVMLDNGIIDQTIVLKVPITVLTGQ